MPFSSRINTRCTPIKSKRASLVVWLKLLPLRRGWLPKGTKPQFESKNNSHRLRPSTNNLSRRKKQKKPPKRRKRRKPLRLQLLKLLRIAQPPSCRLPLPMLLRLLTWQLSRPTSKQTFRPNSTLVLLKRRFWLKPTLWILSIQLLRLNLTLTMLWLRFLPSTRYNNKPQ